MSAIENALERELWKLITAHQCTAVVLNYSCCGVAGVVLGLNWPVCSLPYPKFDVSREILVEGCYQRQALGLEVISQRDNPSLDLKVQDPLQANKQANKQKGNNQIHIMKSILMKPKDTV